MAPRDEAVAGVALHALAVARDPTASTAVYDRYNAVLETHLRHYRARKNLYWVEDDAIVDAAVDAILNYIRRPEQYNPTRGKTLGGYLKMAAVGDFLNIINKGKPPADTKIVQFPDDDWNKGLEDPHDGIAAAEDEMVVEEMLAEARKLLESDEERIVFDLLVAGERSNAVFAEHLGLPNPDSKEAARYVNQIKERLSKRFKRRRAGRMHDAATD